MTLNIARQLVVATAASISFMVPTVALGGVFIQNYVEGPGPNGTVGNVYTAGGATSADLTTSEFGSTAIGSVDSISGTLKSYAYAAFTQGVPYASYSSVTFTEDIKFANGFGLTAYLDYSFDGTITDAGNVAVNNVATLGRLDIMGSTYAALSLNPANCGPTCISGTVINVTGSVPILITPDDISVSASLYAYSQYGNIADFGNTAKFFLRTPDGVSFASAFGFLSTAAPIFSVNPPGGSVPEPSILLLVGLALLTAGASSRRKYQA